MAIIVAEHLSKRYAERAILRDVSLQLDAGEAMLVRGRSGSGKSTLLHLLAGMERPDGGRVALEGRYLDELDDDTLAETRLRTLGYVFQHFNLIPDLTAEENVRLPMVLAKAPEQKERSMLLLDRVGMAPRARAFPTSLSGGEMQRVAIARALANEPRLVLADEPTANLDEENAKLVLDLLRGLADDGRAVLVASHDPLALSVFPRQAQIRDGELIPALTT